MKQDGTERIDYAYDENGNLVSKVVTKGEKIDRWEYAYDLFNQLEQVKKNGEIVSTYIYAPNGFRVEKVGSKGKIHYVPLLNGEVGYRKEFSTNAEYSFIYVGIQHLARVNGVIGGSGKKFYYHNDHLGSALAITDEYGNKVVERDFTPFGERINTDVYDDEPRDPDEDESGFTGKDWDEDVGLYYYNARWYDPTIGRFISEDSVADDPNLYGYCGQNPLDFIDPTGHFKIGKLDIKFKTGFALGMATLGAVESIIGTDNSFSNFIGLISAVKGMKDFADYLKTVRTIETTLSNTVNPNTGEKYTQKEIITYIRSLYYQTPKFDTACGSSIDEQAISDMLEQKSPGIMKALGFSRRLGKEGEYLPETERWRADKTVYWVYGELVDIGHIWTGIDAGINANDTSDLRLKGVNILTCKHVSILGVTVTGDLVSEAGFSADSSDFLGDLYGAVLGNRVSRINVNNGKFSISNYLAGYFVPTGDWNTVATEFVTTYKPYSNNVSWRFSLDIAARGIRKDPVTKKSLSLGYLESTGDPYYYKNSIFFYTKLIEMIGKER